MNHIDCAYLLDFDLDTELVERALKASSDFELVKNYCARGGWTSLLSLMRYGVSNTGLGAVCREVLKTYYEELMMAYDA